MVDRAALRAALDAMARYDIEELLLYVDPDFEGVVPPDLSAEPDSYTGEAGLRRYFALFEETVDNLRFEPTVAEETADGALLLLHITGTGRGSGLPLDAVVVAAITMRGDKVVRMHGFRSLEEARAASG